MTNKKNHTPAFKIFHYYIMAYIPAAYANKGMEQLIGGAVYKSKQEETNALNEKVLKQLTTAQLVELHKEGCPIIFYNPEDTVRVYRYIKDHVAKLENDSSNLLHTNRIPIDDLVAMDDFAESLHGIARIHSPTRVGNTPLGRKLDNLMARRGMLRGEAAKEETIYHDHQSLVGNLTKRALERNLMDE